MIINNKKMVILGLLNSIYFLPVRPTQYHILPAFTGTTSNSHLAYQQEEAARAKKRGEELLRRQNFVPVIQQVLTILGKNTPEHDYQAATLLKTLLQDQKDTLGYEERNKILWTIEKLTTPELRDREEAKRVLKFV